MINYADKAKNPSFSTSKLVRVLHMFSARVAHLCLFFCVVQVLNILQTHYPERLGTALILNVPFLLHAFYKMISPLVDPVTRNKMKFNPKPVEDGLFAADDLFKDSGWGGSRDFVWDHDKYWAPFVRMCDEVRAAQMARWRKLGARVGCDEWDYKSDVVVDRVEDAAAAQAVAEGAAVPQVGDVAGQTAVSQAAAQLLATDDVLASGDSEVHSPAPEESEVVVSGAAY